MLSPDVKKIGIYLFIAFIAIVGLYFAGCSEKSSKRKSGRSMEKAEGAKKAYQLMISPDDKRSRMFREYKSFSQYLSKSTGFKIELFIPKDFKEFREKVKNQGADLFYMDPGIYLEVGDYINKDYLYIPLCGFIDELKGKPLETGCIIVRTDSNIKTIQDVKGKRVIFGPQNSATRWIAAQKLFIDNGIDLEKDLAEYSYGESCMDIVLDIYYQKADVGCIRRLMCPLSRYLVCYEDFGLDTEQLSTFTFTCPIITWVFTCSQRMNEKDMDKIAGSLLKISELDLAEKEIFPQDIQYKFIKAADRNFDDLRRMVDYLNLYSSYLK